MKLLKKLWFSISAACILFSAGNIAAGTTDLIRTGQTKCYAYSFDDSQTIETACSGTGQDGDSRTGTPWPAGRFTVSGDCVTDNLTGLIWTKHANSNFADDVDYPKGRVDWQGALDYVTSFNSSGGACGATDWRLPNIFELESLMNLQETDSAIWLNTQGFTNVQSYCYSSSTSNATNTEQAWSVSLEYNMITRDRKNYSFCHVWPVRSGAAGPIIMKTAQANCYDSDWHEVSCGNTGQDGDIQAGVAWPEPRYSDNGDETVSDNLTGLVWLKDTSCMQTKYPEFDAYGDTPGDGDVSWTQALEFVKGINSGLYLDCGGGQTDWRLPNRKDLFSLIYSLEETPPGEWPIIHRFPKGHPFTNLHDHKYWTSTTDVKDTDKAWRVVLGSHGLGSDNKEYEYTVWPVRGGKIVSDCAYSIASDSKSFTYKAGSGSVKATATGDGCSVTASSGEDWLTVSVSGTTVNFSVTANTGSSTRTGTITIGDETFTVTQTAGTPKISATPASVSFATVKTGTEYSKTITIKNTGTAALAISSVTLSGTNASEFNQTNECSSIAIGSTCAVSVKLTATSVGNKSAYAVIASNDPKKAGLSIKLSGIAAPPKIIGSPASLRLSSTSVGSTSAAKTLTIKNLGVSDLLISSVSITGANPSEFTVQTNTCTAAIAKGAACTIGVTFTPSEKGKRAGTLAIASNDPKKATLSIKMSGKGI